MIVAMEINAAIDRRMYDDTAGVGLVGVVPDLEIFAETGSNLREIVFRCLHGSETSRTLDRVLSGREAGLCEDRGEVTVPCSVPGMIGLRHGAEHFTQSGSLSGR